MSDQCGNCSNDIIKISNTSIGGKDVEIIGEPPIYITKQEFSTKKVFTIKYLEAIALQGSMQIYSVTTSPAGSDYLQGVVPLKGAQVTDLSLSWTLIKEGDPAQVATQILDGNGIDNLLRSFTYNSITPPIEYTSELADRTFNLNADDGLGNPNSSVDLSAVLNFGNKIYFGEGPFIDNDDNALKTLLFGFDFSIQKNKTTSYSPLSLDPAVYVYIAIPDEFGTTNFTDENSPIDVNPMKLHRGTFSMSNGISDFNYNVYVSKKGSLRGSLIKTV